MLSEWNVVITNIFQSATGLPVLHLGTCEASWFDSISNRTFDSRFDSNEKKRFAGPYLHCLWSDVSDF